MRGTFAIVGAIAEAQHGRVTRRQLLAEGIDAKHILRWLADGRLRRVHYGVYAVGHVAPSMHADYIAAVFAGGAGAKLSCAPAAHVFKLRRAKRPPPPEITVPTLHHRRRPGIVIHRVKALHPYDTTEHEGIPTTSVPRVLLDLAPRLPPSDLARLPRSVGPPPHDAHPRRGLHRPQPEQAGHREAAPRARLGRHPQPCHATRDGLEQDGARRRRSRHIAFTWGDVVERPAATVAELRQLLSRARSSPTRLEPRA